MTAITTEKRDAIRRELESIAKTRSGLTPEAVVKSAKSQSSPLHEYFTWDDTEAARRYRMIQASFLIRSIKVIVETPKSKQITVRAFVNVRSEDSDGTINLGERGQYVPIHSALQSEQWRSQLLANAKRELSAFRNKYSLLSELAEIWDAIEKLEKAS